MIAPLSRGRAALLVVDIQERLLPAMPAAALADVMRNTAILIAAARPARPADRGQPAVPQGPRAPRAQPIEDALASAPAVHRFDKLEFSAAAAPGFAELAAPGSGLGRDQWIVCGMESHVCVYQTARDLVARGWDVHVVRRRGVQPDRRQPRARARPDGARRRDRHARPRPACSTCSAAPAPTNSARCRGRSSSAMAGESTGEILKSLAVNVVIAVSKGVAAFLTGLGRDARRDPALVRRLRQPAAAAAGRARDPAAARSGAPARLRPHDVLLLVHRRAAAVLRRRRVLDPRGHPQDRAPRAGRGHRDRADHPAGVDRARGLVDVRQHPDDEPAARHHRVRALPARRPRTPI